MQAALRFNDKQTILRAAAHFRPGFLRAGGACYMVYAAGVLLARHSTAYPLFPSNRCSCCGNATGFSLPQLIHDKPTPSDDGIDHNAIDQCF